MSNVSLTVVDPQKGFCDTQGSLGRYHGQDELREIEKVIPNIVSALEASERKHLVQSEYSPGQFTQGHTDQALSYLCVPEANIDCNLIPALSKVNFHSQTTKHLPSALTSAAFCSELERDLRRGVEIFVLAGFLIEHCIRATAEDLARKLAGTPATVVVASDLSASRTVKYHNNTIARTVAAMSEQGIGYLPWAKITGRNP